MRIEGGERTIGTTLINKYQMLCLELARILSPDGSHLTKEQEEGQHFHVKG